MITNNAPAPLTPPDPMQVAQAQFGTNLGTAAAQSTIGNINQVGPTGSTTYSQSGTSTITGPGGVQYSVPQYTQTTQLSPEQQQLYNTNTATQQGLANVGNQQVGTIGANLGTAASPAGLPGVSAPSTSGLPEIGDYFSGMTGMPTAQEQTPDFSADRQRVEQAMFDRINPQLERDRASLEAQLSNQGFQRGTEAFNTAMDQYGRQVNDVRLGITERGLQEQQGLFSMSQADRARYFAEQMGLRGAQFGEGQARTGIDQSRRQQAFGETQGLYGLESANRNRAMQEQLAYRNQPINELTAMMSGSQVSMPGVQQYNPAQVGQTNYGDFAYNSAALAQKNYEAQQNAYNAELSGMYGLAGSALGAGARMYTGRA